MKRINIIYCLMAVVLAIPFQTLRAQQTLRTAYFMEGYSYRHQLNPAFAPGRSYVSFPVLGNLNVGVQGNYGVSDILYKMENGDLTTFMNESVSADEFLGNINNNNKINADVNLNIMSVGFYKWKGFNVVELNSCTGVRTTLPYSLFEFMKKGQTGESTSYDISGIGVNAYSYATVALGHQHDISKKVSVGGKLKFLVGLGYADATINQMNVTMSQDEWKVQAEGTMNLACKDIYVPTYQEAYREITRPEQTDQISYEDIEVNSVGPTGFGVAVDLGVTYKVHKDLEVSMALLDLGYMSWNNVTKASTPNKTWTFDGFHDIAVDSEDPDNDPNEWDNQIEDLGDQLGDCVNLQKIQEKARKTQTLGATLNIGAQYTLPSYDKLKFGFLSTTRINGKYSWSEGRFSANVSPVKCLEASINYGISTFGNSFGWMVNLHTKGFSFFIGSDHQFFNVTPQYVPVNNANANISMGINFPIGQWRR